MPVRCQPRCLCQVPIIQTLSYYLLLLKDLTENEKIVKHVAELTTLFDSPQWYYKQRHQSIQAALLFLHISHTRGNSLAHGSPRGVKQAFNH